MLAVSIVMTKKPDNPSIPEEHLPTDKHFTSDGRKLKDLDYVGESAPDVDPEQPIDRSEEVTAVDPVGSRIRRAGSPPGGAKEGPAASRR